MRACVRAACSAVLHSGSQRHARQAADADRQRTEAERVFARLWHRSAARLSCTRGQREQQPVFVYNAVPTRLFHVWAPPLSPRRRTNMLLLLLSASRLVKLLRRDDDDDDWLAVKRGGGWARSGRAMRLPRPWLWSGRHARLAASYCPSRREELPNQHPLMATNTTLSLFADLSTRFDDKVIIAGGTRSSPWSRSKLYATYARLLV